MLRFRWQKHSVLLKGRLFRGENRSTVETRFAENR